MKKTKVSIDQEQRSLLGRWLQATHLHGEQRQQDVADSLGIDRSAVSRLYSGKYKRSKLYELASQAQGLSLSEALERARAWQETIDASGGDLLAPEQPAQRARPWRLAFINNKGGVGKTTTCVNFAGAYAHLHDKRVLLVDLDSQGNATKCLTPQSDQGAGLLDGLDALLEGQDCEPYIVKTESGIDVMPGGSKLKQVERMSPTVTSALGDMLDALPDDYDVILFDTPPALGNLTSAALLNTDHVCIVTTTEPLATDGIPECVAAIRYIKRLNPKLELLGIIPNQVRAQLRVIDRANLRDIRDDESWGHLVTDHMIHNRVDIVEPYYSCQTIFGYAPGSKSAIEYKKLVRELEERRHG